MKIQLSLFIKEALLFGSTLALGIFVAYRYVASFSASLITQAPVFSFEDLGIVIVVIVLMWLANRVPRVAHAIFWVFLTLIVLSGSQAVIGSFAPYPWDVVGSFAVLLIFFLLQNVLVHDIAMVVAIAGIAAVVGITITPSVGVVALVVLSFYDIIAVYKTKHMVRMAEGMIRSGAVFGFIIPNTFKKFFASRREARARVGTDFMMLGSGDIGLPAIFVASLVRQSLPEACIVAVFVMLGLFATHLLFVGQTNRKPMAALPPIATMTMLGYVVALLII